MVRRDQSWFDAGRLAALSALFGLLLAAIMPMPAQSMRGSAIPGAVICHMADAAGQQPPGQHAPGHHQDGMCGSCCLLHCAHAAGAILATALPLPLPTIAALRGARRATPARAPPAQAEDAAYPRGPPALA